MVREYTLVYNLFVLNVALQMFDAVATYQGLEMGVHEANPILLRTFNLIGVTPTLLLFKAQACGLLFLLNRNPKHRLVIPALTFLAGVYLVLSVIPWAAKFSALMAQTV